MTAFKKTVLFIHRWLGFTSGLVVFIVSITGCIFCFQDEIQDALYDYRHVQVQNQPYMAASKLRYIAIQRFPKMKAEYTSYLGKNRPSMVIMEDKSGYRYVYSNPYTGEIIHVEDPSKNFFTIVEFIHMYLLLPPAIGKWVVGVSVIIFVALMITGIILWWPKRKTDRKRSFTIKWGGRWRRVNYDLHNVLGFYATGIALILAVSGLAITWEWVSKGVQNVANGGKDFTYETKELKSDMTKKGTSDINLIIDQGIKIAQSQSPQAEMIGAFEAETESGVLYVTTYSKSLHYAYRDTYEFDKYTGKLLKYLPHVNKSPGLKLVEMNYDIHVGQIAGLSGKIIAFLASLICATLPVTGFIIWLGKRNKSKSKKVRGSVHRRTHKQLQATVK
jgi:uncharacterized iron-regulated membrane protein